MVASVNVPVRLAAWSRASFSWLRTILNEGMQKPKRKERDKKKGRGEDVGARTEAEDWRAQTTCRTSHDDNERPRWPDLSLPLSRERLTGSTRSAEELHATAESCRFFAPPPIGSLPRRRLLLRRVLRCVRWAPILTPRFSLGHASRPSEFSPNFLSWALQLKAQRASDQPGALSWEEGRRDPETQRTPCTFSLLASVFLEALSCPMVSGRMNATSQTSLWLLQLSGDRFRKLKTARHPPSMSNHHNERAAGRTPQLEESQPRIGIK